MKEEKNYDSYKKLKVFITSKALLLLFNLFSVFYTHRNGTETHKWITSIKRKKKNLQKIKEMEHLSLFFISNASYLYVLLVLTMRWVMNDRIGFFQSRARESLKFIYQLKGYEKVWINKKNVKFTMQWNRTINITNQFLTIDIHQTTLALILNLLSFFWNSFPQPPFYFQTFCRTKTYNYNIKT